MAADEREPLSELLGERTIDSPEDMRLLGVELGRRLRAGDVVVLSGVLGAGKTTLTRGIGDGLGVRGPVASPTFVLARTHPSLHGGVPLVHIDAYRLADARELDDLDIDVDRSAVVVEWGAGMAEALADSWLEILIERPQGAGAGSDSGDGAARPADRVPAPEDQEDGETVEARRVRILGRGPRWRAAE